MISFFIPKMRCKVFKFLRFTTVALAMACAFQLFPGAPSSAPKTKLTIRARFQSTTPLIIAAPDSVAAELSQRLSCAVIFKLLPPVTSDIATFFKKPPLFQWRDTKDGVLAVVKMTSSSSATLRLFTVQPEQQILERTIQAPNQEVLLQELCDVIYQGVSGEKGFFRKKLTYDRLIVGKERHSGKSYYCYARTPGIMDPTGKLNRFLGHRGDQASMARICGDTLMYVGYDKGGAPSLYMRDLRGSGADKRIPLPLSTQSGGASSVAICDLNLIGPQTCLVSLSRGDSTNIWRYQGGQWQALTSGPDINVSPTRHPSTGSMVFVSSRCAGLAKLMKSDSNGAGVSLLSPIKGRYYAPSFSPDGENIAFIRQDSGYYYLGLMRADGGGQRMILSGYLMDAPTWLNNRAIMVSYTSARGAKPMLCIVDVYSPGAPHKIKNSSYGMDMPCCIVSGPTS